MSTMRFVRRVLRGSPKLLVALCLSSGEASAAPPTPPHVAGEVIVGFRAGFQRAGTAPPVAQADARFGRRGARILPRRPGRDADTAVVLLDPKADVVAAAKAYAGDPAVLFAEPNWIGSLASIPSDPLYSAQRDDLAVIGMEDAWAVQDGADSSVVVAVIDSGIDGTHEDLVAAVDVVNSVNFAEPGGPIRDDLGHGTRIAGLIGATANNGIGMAGVAHGCRLLSLDVADPLGQVRVADVVSAVNWASGHGADVVNMSLRFAAPSTALEQACSAADQAGVLLVAAAGNDNQGDVAAWPASLPPVLGVGSLAKDGVRRASFSNFNGEQSDLVDLVAPGETIFSTCPSSQYNGAYGSGTSFSAPLVAGVGALLKARYPAQGGGAIRAHLLATASVVGPEFVPAGGAGHGRLDAGRALLVPMEALLSVSSTAVDDAGVAQPNGAWDKGETVRLRPALRNDGADLGACMATLSTTDSLVTVLDDQADWSPLAYGAVGGANGDGFQVRQSASAPARQVWFRMTLAAVGLPPTSIPFSVDSRNLFQFSLPVLTGNVHLTSDTTYLFTSTNTVLVDGATLTIDPGTTLRFRAGSRLELRGSIVAEGSTARPITFTSETGNADPWQGAWLRVQCPAASLRHCIFQFGPVLNDSLVAEFADCDFIQTGGAYGYTGPGAPTVVTSQEILPSNPVADGQFGTWVTGVEDFTGDGRGDVAVFAKNPGSNAAGLIRGYSFDGQSGALLHTLASPTDSYEVGHYAGCIAGVPDLTGDGRGDIAVGATVGINKVARVYVFDGAGGGFVRKVLPVGDEAFYEISVSGSPDVTGDGLGDIVVGTGPIWTKATRAHLFDGGTGGLVRTWTPVTLEQRSFAASVSSVPDLTGDGWPDVLVGAYRDTWAGGPYQPGVVYVYDGRSGGAVRTLISSNPHYSEHFGLPVLGVPDLTGDGLGEVVASGYAYSSSQAVYVINGGSGECLYTLAPPPDAGGFGCSLAWLPEFAGGTGGQLAVGSNGKVYVFDGLTGALLQTITSPGGTGETSFGQALASIPSSGGTRQGRLVVGAPGATAPGAPVTSGRAYILTLSAPAELLRCRAMGNSGGGLSAFRAVGCEAVGCGTRGISAQYAIDCVASGNGGVGIQASVIQNGDASGNGGGGIVAGALARDSRATGNTGIGIQAGRALACTAAENQTGIVAAVATGCVAQRNAGVGISATGGVTDSIAEGNGSVGIQASTINGCAAVRNGAGLSLSSGSTNCYVAENQGIGVQGGSLSSSAVLGHSQQGIVGASALTHVWVARNTAAGVEATGQLVHVASTDNGGAGIVGCTAAPWSTVEGSSVTGNGGDGVVNAGPVHGSTIRDNAFAGAGYDVRDARSSTVVQTTDYQRNYWGPATTAEMAATGCIPGFGPGGDLSRISDFWDDPSYSVAVVDSCDWLDMEAPGTGPDASAPACLVKAVPGRAEPVNVGFTRFELTFSEDMATTTTPAVTFGLAAMLGTSGGAYAEKVVEPDPGWINPRSWRGVYWVQSDTGDGLNALRVSRALSADGFLIPDDTSCRFTIDTTLPGSANSGTALGEGSGGLRVSWTRTLPPDFSRRATLAGFNVLRSTTGEQGTFARINADPIPGPASDFLDSGAHFGVHYYYQVFGLDDELRARQWTPTFEGFVPAYTGMVVY